MALAFGRPSTHPSDARIACPVCGGLIHPIAGRCKHCRTDLVALRDRASAAAILPTPAHEAAAAVRSRLAPARAVGSGAGGVAAPTISASDAADRVRASAPGHHAASATASAPVALDDGVGVELDGHGGSTWSRRWPLLVGAVAAVAIIVCVALLVTGDDAEAGATPTRGRMPAVNDGMNTEPMPNAGGADPWTQPSPIPSSPTPSMPDPAAPTPLPAPADPNAAPRGGGASAKAPPPERFSATMMQAVCARLSSCGIIDTSIGPICDQVQGALGTDDDIGDQVRAGTCRYDEGLARSCLTAIASFPCDPQGTDVSDVLLNVSKYQDCMTALRCDGADPAADPDDSDDSDDSGDSDDPTADPVGPGAISDDPT